MKEEYVSVELWIDFSVTLSLRMKSSMLTFSKALATKNKRNMRLSH